MGPMDVHIRAMCKIQDWAEAGVKTKINLWTVAEFYHEDMAVFPAFQVFNTINEVKEYLDEQVANLGDSFGCRIDHDFSGLNDQDQLQEIDVCMICPESGETHDEPLSTFHIAKIVNHEVTVTLEVPNVI